MSDSALTRRQFIKVTSAAGASLIIGFYLGGCEQTPTPQPSPLPTGAPLPTAAPAPTALPGKPFKPNAYLRIDGDGSVTITVHRSEMGQGVQTAIPMIVADELEADWSKVRVEQAPADPRYGDQVTGGSVSISQSFDTLRMAGAIGRSMLIAAAAQTWACDKETCVAENGTVVHPPSGRRLTYGELVATAATLELPRGDLSYKDPKEFRIIGTRVGQLDNPNIVTGRAVYGLDVRVPGMLYATVARCPVFGGSVASFDATRAKAIEGVRAVMSIDSGVAVVADSTWHAIQGRDALEVKWDEGEFKDLSSDSIRFKFDDLVTKARASEKAPTGHTVEATYEAPYLAHATMEPMNAVADVRADKCEVWAPTQDRQQAKYRAGGVAQLPSDQVEIHVPLIGSGCGRRLMVDYVLEAVQISQAMRGPVQVVWTREDDIRHDFYRPASYHWLRAELDEKGMPVSWLHYIASQGIDGSSPILEGANNLPYRIPKQVTPLLADFPVPTGYWRSVYNSQNAFANECFLDEIAAVTHQDPFEFRLKLLDDSPLKTVLELAATKAGWGTPAPEGRARGIACHVTWGSTPVAQVAEVSVSKSGAVKVHRVVCAVDCGLAVNPDMVEAQMEGGIAFGLTGLLKGEITLKNGRVEQSNFQDYLVPRMEDMPAVEVYIVPGADNPRGVGEMAGPVIVPAVVNAIYAAIGKRLRHLPIRPEDCRT